MKLSYMIMILIILQASILLFDGLLNPTSFTYDPYNATINLNNTDNVFWDFATDPTGWSSSGLFVILLSIIGVAGAIGIGVYLYTKSDLVLLFTFFGTLLGIGAVPVIQLYNLFNRNPAMWGCTGIPCPTSIFVWTLTGGVFAIFWVMACIEWWSGRPTS